MGNTTELRYLLKARAPLLVVRSHEENRVEATFFELMGEGISLYRWSWSNGMERYTAGVGRDWAWTAVPNVSMPKDAIDYVLDQDLDGIFIFRDFSGYINDDLEVRRKIKDLAFELSSGDNIKVVVLVEHDPKLPEDVEKLVATYDFELPTYDEISEIITEEILPKGSSRVLGEERLRLIKDTKSMREVITSLQGLTKFEIIASASMCLIRNRKLDPQQLNREKRDIIKKSGVLDFYESEGNMQQIGGLHALKEWVGIRGKAFTPEARAFGLPNPKGVLLLGLPGTGKSLIAKTIGNAWAMPVLKLDMGSLFNMYVGETEANLRKALDTAEAVSPCILWVN